MAYVITFDKGWLFISQQDLFLLGLWRVLKVHYFIKDFYVYNSFVVSDFKETYNRFGYGMINLRIYSILICLLTVALSSSSFVEESSSLLLSQSFAKDFSIREQSSLKRCWKIRKLKTQRQNIRVL